MARISPRWMRFLKSPAQMNLVPDNPRNERHAAFGDGLSPETVCYVIDIARLALGLKHGLR